MARAMREIPDTDRRPSTVCSARYALRKLKAGIRLNRWELEEISKSSSRALEYALYIGARWPMGEPAILDNIHTATEYAIEVVQGRWEEAEPIIFKDRNALVRYCSEAVKGRLSEAEPIILKDFSASIRYLSDVVKGRWDKLEERIAQYICGKKAWKYIYTKPSGVLKEYMRIVRERSPIIEDALMRSNRSSCFYYYALGIGGKLPSSLHSKMMMFSFDEKRKGSSKKYVKFLNKCRARVEMYLSGLDDEERQALLVRN